MHPQLKVYMKIKNILQLLFLLPAFSGFAQNSTSEDSLFNSGKKPATFVGGYGNFFYQYNSNEKISEINLQRVVLFLGHRFNDKFSFISEIEVEDAKVSGGEEGGEIAFEQAYIKFNVSRNSYFTAGLFIPRIGILNENHLPNTFNGNERTQVETYIIPSTWRELGIGFYTQLDAFPVDLSFALLNGLNSSAFEHGKVIRGGRYEGRNASANNLALTGAMQYNKNNFKFQISAYAGGTVGISSTAADTLNLDSGPFGTPVLLAEVNAQYNMKAFTIKALATSISIPDAEKINTAYSNNTPKAAYGLYGEASYDFLYTKKMERKRSLLGFIRYEIMDMNSKIPSNGINDPVLNQKHIIAGLCYLPIPNLALKADVRLSNTGDQNPVLVTPDPSAPAFKNDNSFVNLGIGFSF